MNRKMYWGIAALIILLGTAFVFIMLRNQAEIRELKRQLAEAEKLLETGINQPTGVNSFNTRPDPDIIRQNYENKPNDGNEYVWHGDHWHRVPNPDAPRYVDTEPTYEKPEWPKSDLPDKLPAVLPTSAEIQQMSWADLNHLANLLDKKVRDLRKIDPKSDEALRLKQVWAEMIKRKWEIEDEIGAEVMAEHEEFVKTLPIELPATEDRTGVIIEVGEAPKEGGK